MEHDHYAIKHFMSGAITMTNHDFAQWPRPK